MNWENRPNTVFFSSISPLICVYVGGESCIRCVSINTKLYHWKNTKYTNKLRCIYSNLHKEHMWAASITGFCVEVKLLSSYTGHYLVAELSKWVWMKLHPCFIWKLSKYTKFLHTCSEILWSNILGFYMHAYI